MLLVMIFECLSLAHPIQEPASQLQLQPSQERPMRAQPPQQPAKPSQLGSYQAQPGQRYFFCPSQGFGKPFLLYIDMFPTLFIVSHFPLDK